MKAVKEAFERYNEGKNYWDRMSPVNIISFKNDNENFEVHVHNTLMGILYPNGWIPILVLTLQDFKSVPLWNRYRKAVAHCANDYGMFVIFVDGLDMGFGAYELPYTKEVISKQLLKVSAYSQDNDIKTAVCLHNTSDVKIYTYNQKVYDFDYYVDIMQHAEHVAFVALNALYSDKDCVWRLYCMLEPCYNCLQECIDNNCQQIFYYYNHKEKWNSNDYLLLCDDLFNSKLICPKNKRAYKYIKLNDIKINKYYGGKNDTKAKN